MIDLDTLGNGKVEKIESGQTIFILDSYEKNPVVKPQDIGLTWYDNGELKTGAVFNGGAEYFEDRVSFYQDATEITEKANSLMKNWAWKGTAWRTIPLKYGL